MYHKVQFWGLFCSWLTSTIFLVRSSSPASDCLQTTASSTGKSATSTTQNCYNRTHSAWGIGRTLAKWASTPASATPSESHQANERVLTTIYHLNGQQLVVASSNKYLGVTITDDLSWTNHAETVMAKGNRTVGFLRRNFRNSTTKVRSATYVTFSKPYTGVCLNCMGPLQAKRRPGAWKGTSSSSKVRLQQLQKQDTWYRTIAARQSEMEQPWTQ